MSTSEPVVDTSDKPADQNAQASADAEKLLAELQSEAGSRPQEQSDTAADTNGTDKNANAEQHEAGSRPEQRKDSGRREKNDRGESGRGGRGGFRGRGGSKNFRNNIKSDLTTQEISKDPVAIRKQVEFYFSDSNLPMDKFLLGKVGGSQNIPVELSIIHSFKRMRHFQPLEAIVEALKESTFLDLTDNDTCVRRKEPLPEVLKDGPDPSAVKVFEDKAMPRSVYVKGFGEELPSTQFDIEAFFAPYGPTNAIRLRRTENKLFKGSVFAEFENEDLATKFLELESKPKYKGRDLQIMSKKEYCDKKVEDIKAGKIKASSNRGLYHKDDRKGGRDFKRKRDDEDNRDWRERRDEDRKNGFRDGQHRDSRDKGRRDSRRSQIEKDDRGVPVIKASTTSDDMNKRDTGKADALAKARAAVEAEKKKEGQETADNIETTEQEGKSAVRTEDANAVAQSLQDDAEVTSKKRAREDDGAVPEPEAKRADMKAET